MSIQENKPSKRAEEVRQQRRRRTDLDEESNAPLAVNEKYLDRANYEYRYINDSPGRLQKMYDQDWDKVDDPRAVKTNNNEGAYIRKLVGANKDGSPLFAYLCRKPKWMHAEDRARKMGAVKETEDALKRGLAGKDGALSANDPNAYIPDGRREVASISTPRRGAQTYEP